MGLSLSEDVVAILAKENDGSWSPSEEMANFKLYERP